MDDWICSTDRKVHQRKLNKLIRRMNKNIREDDWWKGRFFARQYSAEFYRYEDGSGGELCVYLRFYDKKDMKYQEYYGDSCSLCHWGGARLWWTMNEFITNVTSTWKSDTHPKDVDKSDYINKTEDEVIKEATPYVDWPVAVHW